jgi:hypothetical protein
MIWWSGKHAPKHQCDDTTTSAHEHALTQRQRIELVWGNSSLGNFLRDFGDFLAVFRSFGPASPKSSWISISSAKFVLPTANHLLLVSRVEGGGGHLLSREQAKAKIKRYLPAIKYKALVHNKGVALQTSGNKNSKISVDGRNSWIWKSWTSRSIPNSAVT